MAQENNGKVITLKAADGSVAAYRVVGVSGENQVDVWQTATSLMLGIALNDASATNDAVAVALDGTARACCGASVSAGAILTAQTDTGKVIEATITDNTTTSTVPRTIGVALQSGDTNSVIEVAIIVNNLRKEASA